MIDSFQLFRQTALFRINENNPILLNMLQENYFMVIKQKRAGFCLSFLQNIVIW